MFGRLTYSENPSAEFRRLEQVTALYAEVRSTLYRRGLVLSNEAPARHNR